MALYKEGDKVRIIVACSGTSVGEFCTVGSGGKCLREHGCTCDPYWELVTPEIMKKEGLTIKKPTIMTKLSNMMQKMLDADTKVLVQAGLINGNLELTTEGLKELNTIVFFANKAALVARAQEIVAEEKAEK